MPAPRRVAWEKGPRHRAFADRDLRDGRARRLRAFVVGARSALPTSRNQRAARRMASPGGKSLAPGQTNPYARHHWALELSDSSHTGLARRGGNRIQQGRFVLWPAGASSWRAPSVRGPRIIESLAPSQVARPRRTAARHQDGWGACRQARSPATRQPPGARRTNDESPSVACDPLHVREGSITPDLTPISRPRGAADGGQDATRRAARARFARPFGSPTLTPSLLPRWTSMVLPVKFPRVREALATRG
jgi:hypothetical protein